MITAFDVHLGLVTGEVISFEEVNAAEFRIWNGVRDSVGIRAFFLSAMGNPEQKISFDNEDSEIIILGSAVVTLQYSEG